MRKLFKIAAALLVIVVFLIVAVIIYITVYIDPNDYNEQISKSISNYTSHNLDIKGDIKWSFFPWLGIAAEDIIIKNNSHSKDRKFAEIATLDIRIKILPLLIKKIVIDKLTLKNVNLYLYKNSFGETNFHNLFKPKKSKAANLHSQSEEKTNISISDIAVKNGNIIWKNYQTNNTLIFNKLTLETNNFNTIKPFDLNLSGNLIANNRTLLITIKVKSKALCNFEQKTYTLNQFQVKGTINKSDLIKNDIDFIFNANIKLDLAKNIFSAESFKMQIADLLAEGDFNGINILDTPEFVGSLKIPNFNPKLLLTIFGLNVPKNTWQTTSLNASILTTTRFIKVPKILVNLDNTILQGNASYNYINNKNLAFNISINQIDFGSINFKKAMNYKKPSEKEKGQNSNSKKSNQPTKSLTKINLNGDIKVGTLLLNKSTLNNFSTKLSGTLNSINLHPFKFNFAEGTVNGNANFDFSNINTKISSKLTFTKLLVNNLLKEIFNHEKLFGEASGYLTLHSSGIDKVHLLQNMEGTGNITIEKGKISGLDVGYHIKRANTLISQLAIPKESAPPQTNFDKITDSFQISNGILHTDNLLILADDFKIIGGGNANLAKQLLDFKLKAYGVFDGKPLNFFLPIVVSNTFSAPKIGLDKAIILTKTLKKVFANKLIKELKVGNIHKTLIKPIEKLLQ